MLKKSWIIGVVAMVGLTACMQSDIQRGVVGAAAGAVAADVMGGDVVTGAAIGATAGALCDDVNVCK